jgi:DNA-binding transcriptional LysR family regulator
LERRGTPRTYSALASHDWVGFDSVLDAAPHLKWLRKIVGDPHYVLRVNSTTAQVLACAQGHGVALLPSFVAAHEPRLVRLLPRLVIPPREMWGVTHLDLRANARVQASLTWLARIARESELDARM